MKGNLEYRADWTKVKELQTHLLQDYMAIGLKAKFGPNDWRQKLHDLLARKSSPGNSYTNQYKPTYREIERLGITAFDTANMDVSVICTLLIHDSHVLFIHKPKAPVISYVKCIQDDRNVMEAHSSFNEPDFRLMCLTITAIEHLKRLVQNIREDTNGYAPECASKEFCAKWELRIREFTNGIERRYERLEGERVRYEELMDDVRAVKRSKDPFAAYANIMGDKYNMRNADDTERANLQFQFEKAVADAGLDFPCSTLGGFYFNGNEMLGVERDFHIAAAYYLRTLDSSDAMCIFLLREDRLHMIDLMAAGYLEGHSPEEASRLLAEFAEALPDTEMLVSSEETLNGIVVHQIVPTS